MNVFFAVVKRIKSEFEDISPLSKTRGEHLDKGLLECILDRSEGIIGLIMNESLWFFGTVKLDSKVRNRFVRKRMGTDEIH